MCCYYMLTKVHPTVIACYDNLFSYPTPFLSFRHLISMPFGCSSAFPPTPHPTPDFACAVSAGETRYVYDQLQRRSAACRVDISGQWCPWILFTGVSQQEAGLPLVCGFKGKRKRNATTFGGRIKERRPNSRLLLVSFAVELSVVARKKFKEWFGAAKRATGSDLLGGKHFQVSGVSGYIWATLKPAQCTGIPFRTCSADGQHQQEMISAPCLFAEFPMEHGHLRQRIDSRTRVVCGNGHPKAASFALLAKRAEARSRSGNRKLQKDLGCHLSAISPLCLVAFPSEKFPKGVLLYWTGCQLQLGRLAGDVSRITANEHAFAAVSRLPSLMVHGAILELPSCQINMEPDVRGVEDKFPFKGTLWICGRVRLYRKKKGPPQKKSRCELSACVAFRCHFKGFLSGDPHFGVRVHLRQRLKWKPLGPGPV